MVVLALLSVTAYITVGFAASIPSVTTISKSDPTAVVPQSFLVTYKHGVTDQQASAHEDRIHNKTTTRNSTLSGVTNTWNITNFKAYSIHGDNTTIKTIINSGLVASVEPDHIAKTTDYIAQSDATWGLQRVSHRFSGNTTYTFDHTAGTGTYSYILDTGILTTHSDFGGRARWGANFVSGSSNTDDNGHGTHCAGTVGSSTYGIAKNTTLIAVKVLDSTGSGSYSSVINGLQWVIEDAIAHGRIGSAIISMSLAGGYSAILNSAVNAAYAAGIPVVVAAGNRGVDAANFSPASAQYAITVGATDISDTRPAWSNFGKPVTIFAPGVDIVSTWNSCNTCKNTVSGTSMSVPHVAGMAAYFMRRNGISAPADVVRTLNYYSIGGIVKQAGAGTTTNLLFNGNGDNGGY